MKKNILSVLIVAMFLAMAGGASANSDWWDSDYQYRQQVTVENNADSVMESGYTVDVAFDAGGKALANGDDIRVVYNGIELDRLLDIDAGTVTFMTHTDIPASGSDSNYYVYYGNPVAPPAPADGSNVYLIYDDFEDGNLDGWSQYNPSYPAVISTEWSSSGQYSVKMVKPAEHTDSGIRKNNYDISPTQVVLDAKVTSIGSGAGLYSESYGGWILQSVGTIYDWTGEYTGSTPYDLIFRSGQWVPRATTIGYFDNIRVGKYISPEPATSTGPEEVPTISDANNGHGNDADGVDEDNPGKGCQMKNANGDRKRC